MLLCNNYRFTSDPIMIARTLYDKLWDSHIVRSESDGTALLYVDRHLVHEVTSPQAFEALRLSGRPVRRADLTFATVDHNIPTDAEQTPDLWGVSPLQDTANPV